MNQEFERLQRLLDICRKALSEPGSSWPNDVQRAARCIYEQLYREELTARSMKTECRISGKSFDTKFALYTGLTPKQYILHYRFEISKKVLANARLADVSLTQVALSVGFTSYSAFAKTFRKHEGCSPAVWRRRRFKKLV